MDLLKRVGRRLKSTARSWKNDRSFSRRLALLRVEDELGGRLGFRRLAAAAHEKKDEFILSYLENEIRPVLDAFRRSDDPGERTENAPIWVCWWTGLETAPPLVKRCVESIRANAGEHPVKLISETNASEYLDIPAYILDRHRRGQMGTAHLCDYIRAALLEKYGGLWLDATIYCAFPLPEEYFRMPFFTCRSEYRESRYLPIVGITDDNAIITYGASGYNFIGPYH